jgi:integrase/recombinase XerD
MVGDREELHPEGTYHLDWRHRGKRKRLAVGKDATNALNLARGKQPAVSAVVAEPERDPTLPAAIAGYLAEIRAAKKPKTLAAYTLSLEYLARHCVKPHVGEVERSDLLAYAGALRDAEELAPRTVHNHFANVISFLKWVGIQRIARKGDWPVYVEEEPKTYEPDELTRLFAVCTPEERLLFRFLLYSGFREQEVTYLTWKDLGSSTAAVRHKPVYGWSPKAYKERTVPIPAAFAAELLGAKPVGAKLTDLVLPAPEGGPDKHMLRRPTPYRGGIDLRTVQSWMGHTDLASTMRYLRPARGEKVQAQVEASPDPLTNTLE